MNKPEYTPQPWQTMLLSYALIIFSITINTIVSRALPKIESLILIIYVLGFFTVLVPVVYLASYTSASVVFTGFLNEGGLRLNVFRSSLALLVLRSAFLVNDFSIPIRV
jgi:choline transport protein